MAVKIQLRRDTSTNWTSSNPILSSGEMGVETDTLKMKVGNGSTSWSGLSYIGGTSSTGGDQIKSIAIPSPVASDVFTMFYTKSAMTLSKIESVVRGSSTPSASFSIRYATDRSTAGTEVVTGGITTTSTAGIGTTTFNSGTIPAGAFVWISITATSGTVDELAVSLLF